MKFTYSEKSLKQLKDQYSLGGNGFYSQTWYENESFYTETPPKGTYEIDLGENLTNLTYTEQVKKLKKGFKPIHPAILAEFILSHFKETGKRLLENTSVRTSSVGSDGDRVVVGYFASDGLYVNYFWDGYRRDYVGLASARKSKKSIETGSLKTLESLNLRVEKVENWIKSFDD